MEFENLVVINDSQGVSEQEENKDEVKEPAVCCCCSQNIPAEKQKFDCDNCPHFTCEQCRFIDDVRCVFCKPASENVDIGTGIQVESPSLNEMYSMYFTRKRKINKDHIVDVELSTEEGSVQKQMCKVCQRVFKKSNARYHYTCASGEKPHVCVECGQGFVKKSHLETHLNSHYGVRPFKCSQPKCKASFTQKDKLIRHMKSHNKQTRLMCPICDKLYTSQDILNYHMVKVHSSTKQFCCDLCPRTYKYSRSLRIHKLKHQAKRDYMCEVCGKKYVLSAQLKLHKRSHVVYHRRPFKCRCGRRFMSRRDKVRHELIHTSCHDYECSLCNTTFGRKDNLERHMKNFHQEHPPMLNKHRKLVATVAPFNSKPLLAMRGKDSLTKTESVKSKACKVGKQKTIKKDKPKPKLKANNANNSDVLKSDNNCERISDYNVIRSASSTNDVTSKLHDKESKQNQSVIVPPPQNVVQNRPSVIKSIPPLLPYRILPPDKRFLKSTGELYKSKIDSQTQTNSSMITNQTNVRTGTFQNQNSSTTSESMRRRIPKHDAVDRCFRIIQTVAVREENKIIEHLPSETTKVEDNLGALTRPLGVKKQQSRSSSSAVLTMPEYGNKKHNHDSRRQDSVRFGETTNSIISLNVGGPSLSASLSDSVSEINHEDNLTSSYNSMGEGSYSSYTPCFDSEYFRDSISSYDTNVENLLPNDLDIGFQYINEQLACSEMTFTSESRIIRYVSQETKIVRES